MVIKRSYTVWKVVWGKIFEGDYGKTLLKTLLAIYYITHSKIKVTNIVLNGLFVL